jgi:hypothetical protein
VVVSVTKELDTVEVPEKIVGKSTFATANAARRFLLTLRLRAGGSCSFWILFFLI